MGSCAVLYFSEGLKFLTNEPDSEKGMHTNSMVRVGLKKIDKDGNY